MVTGVRHRRAPGLRLVTPGAIEYLFLTTDSLVNFGGRITARGASARLGSLAPMHALSDLGYDARTYSISADPGAAEKAVRAAKRVVFGEMFHVEDGWNAYRRLLGLIRHPREQAIFSIADDKFDHSDFVEF